MLHARNHRVGGKDDGHRPAQPDPRYVEPRVGRELAEWRQAEQDAGRSRHRHHEQGHDDAGQGHGRQFVRIDQQPKHYEHHYLPQPRESVHERADTLLVHQPRVAHHQSGNVDGQIAVAHQGGGGGERQEGYGQHKYRIERSVLEVDAVDGPHAGLAGSKAHERAHAQLHRQHQRRRAYARPAAADVGYEHYGHHVGHGVVAAALELEGRAQALLEVDAAAAQDGEDRGRVGGRHDRRQQERLGIAQGHELVEEAENQIDERAGDEDGEQHAHRGQHHTGAGHRPYFLDARVHSARKENDRQRQHAHKLCKVGVLEADDVEAVGAEEHADAQKQQQRG